MTEYIRKCVSNGFSVQKGDVVICPLNLKQVIERKYQVYSNKYSFLYKEEELDIAVDKFLLLLPEEKC
jgi:hypothetical protein